MKKGKEVAPLVHLIDERLRRHWSQIALGPRQETSVDGNEA